VMAVRMPLAVVAEEETDAALERVTLRAEHAQAPLADCAGSVPLPLEQFGEHDLPGGERILALRRSRLVVADERMAAVLAGHQTAARRRTDRRAGVELREAHALRR